MTARRVPFEGMAGPGSWAQQGACQAVATEVFFPGRGQSTEPAKAVCRTCPVQDQCREYALAVAGLKGVWGGLAEAERKRLRTRPAAATPTTTEARRPRRSQRGPLYQALKELAASPGRWARVAWYPSPHTAAGMATRLRAGAVAAPDGAWNFEALANDGGSELRARYGAGELGVQAGELGVQAAG